MSFIPVAKDDIAEEESGNEVFDQTPVRCTCSNCGGNVITFIDYAPSWVTYTMALLVFLACGWVSLCVVPLLWPVFKDVVHQCPRCLNILARRSRVQILSEGRGSEVMTLRFGSCAVVLARRYVLIFTCIVALILTMHALRTAFSTDQLMVMQQQPISTDVTWEDFQKDCGPRLQLGNPIHVHVAYDHKYRNRTVSWTGKVVAIDIGINYYVWTTTSRVLIEMPGDWLRRGAADLALLFPTHKANGLGVTQLQRQDAVKFIATFAPALRRGPPHKLLLHAIERAEDVPPTEETKEPR